MATRTNQQGNHQIKIRVKKGKEDVPYTSYLIDKNRRAFQVLALQHEVHLLNPLGNKEYFWSKDGITLEGDPLDPKKGNKIPHNSSQKRMFEPHFIMCKDNAGNTKKVDFTIVKPLTASSDNDNNNNNNKQQLSHQQRIDPSLLVFSVIYTKRVYIPKRQADGKRKDVRNKLLENSNLQVGLQNGRARPPNIVQPLYDDNNNEVTNNSSKHKIEANFVHANHAKFITVITDQLTVLSHSAFKIIKGELEKKSILYKLDRLRLYIYKWKNSGILTAGFIAEELWKIFQHPDLPENEKIQLVRLEDGSEITLVKSNDEEDDGTICYKDKVDEKNYSLYDEKGDVKEGKRLLVDTNAKDALIFACIQELLQKQIKITKDTKGIQQYVDCMDASLKKNSKEQTKISERVTNAVLRLKMFINYVKSKDSKLNNFMNLKFKEILEKIEMLEQNQHGNHILTTLYRNAKGIIYLAVDFEESKKEAEEIQKITGADIFKGSVLKFYKQIRSKKYQYCHFIGHGNAEILNKILGLFFLDITTKPYTIERIEYDKFIETLIQHGVTLFTMSACETASDDSNVVQHFIEKGGLYSYGFEKKVCSGAAPIISEDFYYELFKGGKLPKDAFECGKTAVALKVKNITTEFKNINVSDPIFNLSEDGQGGDPIFKENDVKIKKIYTEHIKELLLLQASNNHTPFLKLFFNFIEKPENFAKVVAALNKNDGKEIDRIKQEMKLKEVLVENISVENVSFKMLSMLQEICKNKLLAQDELTIEQEEKYNEYEKYNANEKHNIGCVHIKGFAGTGKTFLGLYFICKMLIENPNANILFACTQNGFAYFFARWILIRMLSRKVKRGDDETKGEENDNNNDAVRHDPESILNRIHFCTRKTNEKPHKAILQLNEQGNAYLKFVEIDKDETVQNYDLAVIDEAHHIIHENDDMHIWENIYEYFKKATHRVVLSDNNQGANANEDINDRINEAMNRDKRIHKRQAEVYNIELRDVVRSTQAITLFSHLYRKYVETPSCKNKEFGSPIEPFLIVDSNKDDDNNNDTITQYIMRTINALEHVKPVFAMKDEKDLGWFLLSRGRVVIILPDDNPSLTVDEFTMKLRDKIDEKGLEMDFEFFNAETMFGTFPQLRHKSVQIVVDTISNQDGLEYDAAIVVGFDETIKDDDEESILDKKKASVYRAITRAKLFVGIVDKPVQYGLYHSIWTDTELDKSQMEDSKKSNKVVYDKQSKLMTKIENKKNDRKNLDTNNTSTKQLKVQSKPSEETIVDDKMPSNVEKPMEAKAPAKVKKVKQAFINVNNIPENIEQKLGQPKQSLFNVLEDINVELNDTNDQEDDNTNAVDINKSAAYIKWEKEFDGKTNLDLSGKKLMDEDALAIGELLKSNNTLTRLDLDNNNITDDGGIQSIIDGLKTNNTLRTLYLYNNQLSDNMKSQLNAIIQYKLDGSNGYQQVEGGMVIYTF